MMKTVLAMIAISESDFEVMYFFYDIPFLSINVYLCYLSCDNCI